MKRMKLLLVAGCILALTGCGGSKAPTAEELLANPYGESGVQSMDSQMAMEMDMSMSQEGIDMSANISLDCNIKSDGSNSYMKANAKFSLIGLNESEEVEMYNVKMDDGKFYTYETDENSGRWVYYESEESGSEAIDSLKIDSSMFDSYEMVEPKNGDTEFVINGKVKSSSLNMLSDVTDVDSLFNNSSLDGIVFDAVLKFDAPTKQLKSIDLSMPSQEVDGATINKFTCSIVINQINGVTIELPSTVKDTAKPYEEPVENFDDFTSDVEDTESAVTAEQVAIEGLGSKEDGLDTGISEVDTDLYEEPANGVGDSVMTDYHTPDDYEAKAPSVSGVTAATGDTMFYNGIFESEFFYTADLQLLLDERYGEGLIEFYAEDLSELMWYSPNTVVNRYGQWGDFHPANKVHFAMLYDIGTLSQEVLDSVGADSAEVEKILGQLRNKDVDALNAYYD